MALTGDTLDFVQGGVVTSSAQIVDAGATTGHVLTVQADKSIAAAPGGGSVPFDPSSLSALALWLDASQITGLSDGDPVASWPDLSTSGYDAAQADPDAQPVYKAAIQNGLAVVRFDNGGAAPQMLGLSGAGLGLFRNLAAFTVAACWGRNTDDDYVIQATSGTDVNNRRVSLEGPVGAGTVSLVCDTSDASDGALSPGSAQISHVTAVGTQAVVAAMDLVGGGGSIDTSPTSALTSPSTGWTPAPTRNTASLAVTIGGTGAGSGMVGDIFEVLVYQRALNALERREVLEYLSVKWGTL